LSTALWGFAWRSGTRLLGLLPRRLKSTRQLARESLRRGAIQKVGELGALLTLVADQAPEVVVEVGTARGGTLWAFCQVASPNAVVAAIDLPLYLPAADEELESLARADQTLVLLRRDSHSEETRDDLVRSLEGRPVDFLFIDGDHSYEGVKRDFELYAPLVRPGGLVAFHDILPHPNVPHPSVQASEVDRFWEEIKPGYRHDELVRLKRERVLGRWGGIGVIYWEGTTSGAGDRGEVTGDDALALRPGTDHRHG
jgi:predicted O-methyltransferase YrrM